MAAKHYTVDIASYMKHEEENTKKLKEYLDCEIKINERFPTFKVGSFLLKSFKLTDFKFEGKDSTSKTLTFVCDLDFILTCFKAPEEAGYDYVQKWTIQYVYSPQSKGEFTFTNYDKTPIGYDKLNWELLDLKYFEVKLIVIVGAIYNYMLDNPQRPNSYLRRVKNKLTPEVGLMAYNSINQQMVQKSFRDIDTAEQADGKYSKTTAKGLEMSLSTMLLPTANKALKIHNVELDGSFRISFGE